MTGIAYLIEAATLLRSYTGLDLHARPFFRATAAYAAVTPAATRALLDVYFVHDRYS